MIPSVDRCMGCHKFIGANSPDVKQYAGELDKLKDYAQKGESIPWVKVNDTPDHVRFSHEPHVQGGFECQTCHGPVEEMDTAVKLGWDDRLEQPPLGMGWCVQCHIEESGRVAEENLLERGASKSDPDWYANHKKETKTVKGNLLDCYTCHK